MKSLSKNKQLNTLVLSILIGLMSSGGCTLFSIELGPKMSSLEENIVGGGGGNKVLIVEIEGVISNQDKNSTLGNKVDSGMVERVRETLEKAEGDDAIKAILLRINSPGGTVTSSDIIFHELKSFKEKNGIKIYAVLMDVAASGGYYVALAADKIIAHPTSLTGSIGVIAMKANLKGLMEKFGVDMEVVKSGDKKDFLSPMRPFTKEERRLLQTTIDGFHDRFVQLIVENRPGVNTERAEILSDGRIYDSIQAMNKGLIDKIGYMKDALELLRKDLGINEVQLVSYHRKGNYKANIYSGISQARSTNLFHPNLFRPELSSIPMFMYLWSP